MSTTIDSLDIQISSSVQKANTSIDNLVKKLDILATSLGKINSGSITGLANGVNRLSNAMQGMKNVGTADFTRLAKNIEKIGNINTANLNSAASSMSHLGRAFNNLGTVSTNAVQVGDLAKNLSKLGNKGVQNAITNIPQLAVAMRNLMQTLSTAPAVSQNVIQMTNALANLASQGGKVGTASRTMVSGLNNTSNAMNRAKRSSLGLAAAFGKFYATWFLVIRGIKGFMKSVESTTDYIEAYNYYNVAFGKIASEWDKDFEKYGYQNAESYAESFTKRMNETLGKLSGVQVNLETGLLEETGLRNLGLNIQEITQYASQLASVTNSIGQTGEVSLAAAKSMTMLAGDISSLFNISFSDVAQNINSAIIGQSRAVYRYGIDITNATLQTYAYNLGLEKSVSEMTQAEKMQLRMLAILDQSKVSWGDLANTISSPSNMLRQFKNNVKELSMVFGQLFIPVLQKVMPIINGVTIALKRLLVSFANILGIKIDFDAFGQGYSDLGDGADDLSDSLDDVAESAKKAKAGLRSFDELKVINLSDESKDGKAENTIDLTQQIVDATSEYEKVWNEAFAKMENTAQEWADKIEKYLEPVKKIFEDFAIGDFFQAGKDTSALATGIFNFFSDAIDKVDWYGIGKKIGDFLAGIDWIGILESAGKLIWQALKTSIERYIGMFSQAPIETLMITLLASTRIIGTKNTTAILGKGLANIFNGIKGVSSILGASGLSVTVITAVTFSLIASYMKWVSDIPQKKLEEEFEKIKEEIEGQVEEVNNLLDSIEFKYNKPTEEEQILKKWEELNKNYDNLTDEKKGLLKTYSEKVKEIMPEAATYIDETGKAYERTAEKLQDLIDKQILMYRTKAKEEKLAELFKVELDIEYNLTEAKKEAKNAIENLFNELGIEIEKHPLYGIIPTERLMEDTLKSLEKALEQPTKISEKVFPFNLIEGGELYRNKKSVINMIEDYRSIEKGVIEQEEQLLETQKKIEKLNSEIIKSKTELNKKTEEGSKENDNYIKKLEEVKKQITETKKPTEEIKKEIEKVAKETENAALSTKGYIDELEKLARINIPNIIKPSELLEKAKSFSVGNLFGTGSLKIKAYAAGGFPEDGLFMANHNEIIGKFSNGKTAVSNNEQITQGIADAVYPAVYEAVSSAIRNNKERNESSAIRVFIGDREITDIAIQGITDRANRTGKMPFPLYL